MFPPRKAHSVVATPAEPTLRAYGVFGSQLFTGSAPDSDTIASAAFDAISRCPNHGGRECVVGQSYDDYPETARGAAHLGAGPQLPAAGAAGMRAHEAAWAVCLRTVGQERASLGHNPARPRGASLWGTARAVRSWLWACRLAAPTVGLRNPQANGDGELNPVSAALEN